MRDDLLATLDRNLRKSGSRMMETANAWEPGVGSAAEATWDAWVAQEEGRTRGASRILYDARVAPPDTEGNDIPPQLHNWRPMPRQRLPFPALAVLSTDDPFAPLERARALCQDWGCEVREIGPVGHVNAASGLGDWPQGRLWLAEWLLQRGITGQTVSR